MLNFNQDPSLWRHDPEFNAKATVAGFPDDLQVLVHEGGYRKTKAKPEVMWVHTTGVSEGIYAGVLLNNPHQLTETEEGQIIWFRVRTGCPYAIRVTPRYLEQEAGFIITPCEKCGCNTLFDPPVDLWKLTFPDLESQEGQIEVFTTFCNVCGGVMGVKRRAKKAGL